MHTKSVKSYIHINIQAPEVKKTHKHKPCWCSLLGLTLVLVRTEQQFPFSSPAVRTWPDAMALLLTASWTVQRRGMCRKYLVHYN